MTISINTKNFFNDVAAEMRAAPASDVVVPTAIGLLVLVAVFQMAPMLGNSIDNATDLGYDVPATGTLNVTGVAADAQTVTIGTVVFELDVDGNAADGNVAVHINDTSVATVVDALVTAITNNETASGIVTAHAEEA